MGAEKGGTEGPKGGQKGEEIEMGWEHMGTESAAGVVG